MDDLNAQVLAAQGPICLMPGCDRPWTDKAHIEASGMGGQPSLANSANLIGLCRPCHDTFDGRDLQGRQRMLRTLMRALADRIRRERLIDPDLLHDQVADCS